MSAIIDVKYKAQITSLTFNSKLDALYGASGIVEGMAVTPDTGLRVVIGAGHYIIGGVSLYENGTISPGNPFLLASSPPLVTTVYYVIATYDHLLSTVEYAITTNAGLLGNPKIIKLATVTLAPGAASVTSGNIVKGYVLLRIKELSDRMYNKLDAIAASDDTSSDTALTKLVSDAQMKKLTTLSPHPVFAAYSQVDDGTGITFYTDINVNTNGHVIGGHRKTITKLDITNLGIPGSNTTYAGFTDDSTNATRSKLVSDLEMKNLADLMNDALTSVPIASASDVGGVKIAAPMAIANGILSLAGYSSATKVVDSATGHKHLLAESDITNLVNDLSAKATTAYVDQKVGEISSGLVWKDPVTNYANIATTYPSPQDGWVVSVTSTGNTYRYSGTTSTWVLFNLVSIPLSSATVDGLMAKAHYTAMTELISGLNLNAARFHKHSWDQLTSVPTTFTPAAHGHSDPDTAGRLVYAVYA